MWSIFSRSSLSSFPYEILEIISEDPRSIWKLHKGKKKQGCEEVSVFICEGAAEAVIDLAKSAIKRLKMLKHPAVLKFIDSIESEKSVYLVTETVTPVLKWLSDTEMNSRNYSNIAAWGLLEITKALSFLNNDGKLVHNNINSSSVYVTRGGEWKLFGLEYASADVVYTPIKVIPQLLVYDPPELHSDNKRQRNLWISDIWGLGCLIWEVFNHQLDKSMSLQHTSKLPKPLVPVYCELVGSNPLTRPNPKDVMEKLRKPGQFFHNDLIETLLFLDEIQIKDDKEKHRFFSSLSSKLDNIPDFIAKNKILPALLTAHEFSNVGSVLLTPIFKIGQTLDHSDYQSQIVPCVVRMFSSTDRATRLKLLQEMETLSDHLDSRTVSEQIFQPLVTGFQDTNPTIREHTVKAVLYLAPKLNYSNLNIEILKHFARLQSRDDQGGIRTNTTVCLGKIASYLHPDTRQKCLISAFTRAMKDPFPPSRIAGVTAIGATQQYYQLTDVATKVLPSLSHLTVDPEKPVRDAVFRVYKGFLGKLEKVSEDPTLKEVMEKEVSSSASASVGAKSWAGWAVGALASKFYKAPLIQTVSKDSSETSLGPVNKTPSETSSTAYEDSRASTDRAAKSESVTSSGRSDDWKDKNSVEEKKTVTEAPVNLESSEAAGEGWENDDELWGNLEVEQSSSDEVVSSGSSASNLQPMFSHGQTSPSQTDFFSAFETGSRWIKSLSKDKDVPVKPASKGTTSGSSWVAWDSDFTQETGNETIADKAVEQRRQREERKAQRLKEIEAKRASRGGPMKLGAKKMDSLL